MICVKCGIDSDTVFSTEAYPCNCGDSVIVEYNACKHCGTVWKSIDGEPMKDDSIHMSELFGNDGAAFMDLLGDLEDIIGKDGVDCASTMEECIDRCVECNAISYEVGKGLYKCSVCAAEWEVIISV